MGQKIGVCRLFHIGQNGGGTRQIERAYKWKFWNSALRKRNAGKRDGMWRGREQIKHREGIRGPETPLREGPGAQHQCCGESKQVKH